MREDAAPAGKKGFFGMPMETIKTYALKVGPEAEGWERGKQQQQQQQQQRPRASRSRGPSPIIRAVDVLAPCSNALPATCPRCHARASALDAAPSQDIKKAARKS